MKEQTKNSAFEERYQSSAEAVLAWYGSSARDLPWRIRPHDRAKGRRPDPYHVWLSEIMLQQTTVATVKSYFEKFTSIWPTVSDLASADRDDVMSAWAGLGYYARARNLHKAAQVVAQDHGGVFPQTEDALLTLPGVGAYTAAAIASIAFGHRAVVMDGNIERVTARFDKIETPLPKAKSACYDVMDKLTPHGDFLAGDFAQALMDIGATICTPPRKTASGLTAPSCLICPLSQHCAAKDAQPEHLPVKLAKKPRPDRHGHVLIIKDALGNIVLTRRPDQGLLGGLDILPTNDWPDGGGQTPEDGMITERHPAHALISSLGRGQILNEEVSHIFTHFRILMKVETITIEGKTPSLADGFFWAAQDELAQRALPTVMVKCLKAARLL